MDPVPPLTLARQALDAVQKLDPPGVGASSIQECLILQLDKNDKEYNF